MKQTLFENRHQADWQLLEAGLVESGLPNANNAANSTDATNSTDLMPKDFPQRYRYLCHQLALAKHRRYTTQLVGRLNRLVLLCHHRLYQHNERHQYQLIKFLVADFPQVLRVNTNFIWLAFIVFVLPSLVMGVGCYLNDELIYSLMPPTEVRNIESMYDPEVRVIGRERPSDTDLMMFGFYIKNNIGISFRTFASGILFGVGSLLFLFYNGLALGAVAGHLSRLGFDETFYPFVVGHGAFELTAIVFSGAAGLKLGFALIDPGPYRRLDALRLAGREAIQIVYGAILMLVIAAFLEAFWSSNTSISMAIKFAAGSLFWLFVLSYCVFAGKRNESQPLRQ
jgi:uncharacterized membrane protein SpoIIM required for sporulation